MNKTTAHVNGSDMILKSISNYCFFVVNDIIINILAQNCPWIIQVPVNLIFFKNSFHNHKTRTTEYQNSNTRMSKSKWIQTLAKFSMQFSVLPLFRERVSVLDIGSRENTARGVPNTCSTTQSPMTNECEKNIQACRRHGSRGAQHGFIWGIWYQSFSYITRANTELVYFGT
jgi:hypothetical protein